MNPLPALVATLSAAATLLAGSAGEPPPDLQTARDIAARLECDSFHDVTEIVPALGRAWCLRDEEDHLSGVDMVMWDDPIVMRQQLVRYMPPGLPPLFTIIYRGRWWLEVKCDVDEVITELGVVVNVIPGDPEVFSALCDDRPVR